MNKPYGLYTIKKQYAIFQINENGLELANGFSFDNKWLPDMRFETKKQAKYVLNLAYGLKGKEFVILKLWKKIL